MEYKCFRCNHQLMIDNNFMATDIGIVQEDKFLTSEDFMVTTMTRPYCGASYEVYDTPEEEQENYPYFQNEGAKSSVV